ncbi:MAG: hypothetical protein ABJY83_00335, partial [Roseibium sp.]
MTKASDPKARPEVAKKDGNKVSGVYDFVQSPDWQEMLENARKQRAIILAAREANRAASQSSDSEPKKDIRSTDDDRLRQALNKAAGRPETAGKPTQVPNSHQSYESVQKATAALADSQSVKNDRRATENEARGERFEASAVPPDVGSAQGIKFDIVSEKPIDPEPGQKLSEDQVADRLRKSLLGKIDDQSRSRHRTRLGSVAIGCGIGVVASSSVYLILSGLNAFGPTQNASLLSQETVAAIAITEQDAELAERLVSPSNVTSGGADLRVTSATVYDTLSESISADGDTAASSDLALLSPPKSDSLEQSGSIKPELSRLAPSVRSFVPTLVQPPLPITMLSYRSREELNLGFVRFQSAPEIFSTSVALLETTVTVAKPEELLKGVTVTATPTTMRPPVVPIQPGALDYTVPQVSLD